MTGEEFRLLRERIGITQEFFADRNQIKVLTVKRWEANKFSVPESAEETLKKMYDTYLKDMNNLYIKYKDYERGKRIVLVRFNSLTYFSRYKLDSWQRIDYHSYNKAVDEVFYKLYDEYKSVSVVTFNGENYTHYIKEKGLEDSLESVYEWGVYCYESR